MSNEEIHANTTRMLTSYLSPLSGGPWTVQGACITARSVRGCGVPADATAMRLLIEEPDAGWTVAVEVVQRGGKLWRLAIETYYDDHDALGHDGVQAAYADWLGAL